MLFSSLMWLPLLLCVALLSLPGISAQCTSQVAVGYNLTLCPSTVSFATRPVQSNPQVISFYTSLTAAATTTSYATSRRLNISFPFHLYGGQFDQVYVGLAGNLQFGATPTTATLLQFPLSYSYSDSGPIIAAFFSSLFLNTTLGNVSYSVEGSAPTRSFVVRWDHVPYYSSYTTAPYYNYGLSMDVVLYEGTAGLIDIRYYQVDTVTNYIYSTIGLQNNDDEQSFAILSYNGYNLNELYIYSSIGSILNGLTGSTLRFAYTGQDSSLVGCQVQGFDLSNTAPTIDLSFNTSLGMVYFNPCGVVRTGACTNQPVGERASICMVSPAGAVSLFAEYEPQQAVSTIAPSGGAVTVVTQNGQMCYSYSTISFASVNFVCNAAATTPTLTNATFGNNCGATSPNAYQWIALTVQWSAVCSLQAPAPALSTLTSCLTSPGSNYTVSLCPRTSASAGYLPIVQTNPQAVNLPFSSTANTLVNLSFPFYIYDVAYSTVSILSAGALVFGPTPYTSTFSTWPTAGTSSGVDGWPLVLGFGGNSYFLNGVPNTGITYSTEGTAPNRQFVVRYRARSYSTAAWNIYSFDVVLTEGLPGGVEIRYYILPAASLLYFTAGIHGDADNQQYAALGLANYQPLTATLAGQLQGATMSFTYTGRTPSAACQAFGVDLSTISSSDLVYVDNVKNYTYYFHPCAAVSVPICANTVSLSHAQVCQVSFTLTSNAALSVWNPTAVVYAPSANSSAVFRQILADGASCSGGAARITYVDYFCARGTTSSVLAFVAEAPTCTYTLQVQTPAVCASPLACTTVSGDQYNGTLCPTVPNPLTQTSPTSILAGQDNNNRWVPMPFSFPVYGVYYNRMYVSSNGLLQFGASAANDAGDVVTSLPAQQNLIDALPLIAAFGSDLIITARGSVTYSTETSASTGLRIFVVRFLNVDYIGARTAGSELGVSFDVLLYEGSSRMDIRYNQVDLLAGQPFAVGVSSDDGYSFFALYNAAVLNQAVVNALQGATLSLSFNGVLAGSQCGSLGYNFASLMSTDLSYLDQANGYIYYYRPCGQVSNTACALQNGTYDASLCQVAINPSTLQPTGVATNLAVYNPSAAVWSYLPNGVQMAIQDGQKCGTQPRAAIVNYICGTSAAASIVFEREGPSCVFTINVTTTLACGDGNRYTVGTPFVPSTLTSCTTYTGTAYSASWCPRPVTDRYATPQMLTNPVVVPGLGTNDAVTAVPIGFSVYVYDTAYTSVYITTNGLIGFGVRGTSAGYGGTFPDFADVGLTADYFPLLAPLWMNLDNEAGSAGSVLPYSGSISTSVEGSAPNRQFIVRYSGVRYYDALDSYIVPRTASFDVVFSEGEGNSSIAIRYYTVLSNPNGQTAVLGIHGPGLGVYTSILTGQAITGSFAAQLTSSTITYTYTGPLESAVCGGGKGFNLAPISQDLSLTSGGYTYTVHPCGRTTSSTCASAGNTQAASICKTSTSTGASTVLAVESPVATTWSYPDAQTVTSTTADGQLCNGAPAVTVVNYVCSASALTPSLSAVSVSGCTYTFTVNSVAACAGPYNCLVVTGAYYTAQTCNLPPFAATVIPPQTNPVMILNTSTTYDSGAVFVPIPFPFSLYAQTFSQVWISANGILAFGPNPTLTGTGSSLPLSYSYEDTLPVIMPLYTDLYNLNVNGSSSITWSVEGVAPSRSMVIRYANVPYYSGHGVASTERAVSFDATLFENSNSPVVVTYYRVDTPYTTAQTTSIGMQSDDEQSYTQPLAFPPYNYLTAAGAYNLTGARTIYNFTGTLPPNTCGGLGYDLTALIGNTYSYVSILNVTTYVSPCGVVSTPAVCHHCRLQALDGVFCLHDGSGDQRGHLLARAAALLRSARQHRRGGQYSDRYILQRVHAHVPCHVLLRAGGVHHQVPVRPHSHDRCLGRHRQRVHHRLHHLRLHQHFAGVRWRLGQHEHSAAWSARCPTATQCRARRTTRRCARVVPAVPTTRRRCRPTPRPSWPAPTTALSPCLCPSLSSCTARRFTTSPLPLTDW